MKVKGSERHRLLLVAVIILSAALIIASCRSKGDSGSSNGGGGEDTTPPPPPPPVILEFTTTQQAAASSAAVMEARTAADAVFVAAMGLGLTGTETAGIGSFFKPGKPLDPTLAGIVDATKMSDRSPVLRKIARMIAQPPTTAPLIAAIAVNETLTAGFCDNADGQIVILGQNNYDDVVSTSLAYTYDVTFTNCRDDITFSQLDGVMHVVNVESIIGNAFTSDMTVELTQQMYTDVDYATLTQRTVMKGAFGNSDQISNGAMKANGSFAVTTPPLGNTPEKVVTYTFVNANDIWVSTHNVLDGTDSRTDQITSQVVVRTDSAGVKVGEFNIAMNLTDRLDTMNDIPGTKKRYVNGTIDTAWTPDLSVSGCLPGRVIITTSLGTPQTYRLATGYTCPAEGIVAINNATIAYGASIQLGLSNNQTQTFANCAALAQQGGVCAY